MKERMKDKYYPLQLFIIGYSAMALIVVTELVILVRLLFKG